MKGNIFLIEKNVRGAWVIYGAIGVKQYYGYTKAQAKQKYIDECQKVNFENIKKGGLVK